MTLAIYMIIITNEKSEMGGLRGGCCYMKKVPAGLIRRGGHGEDAIFFRGDDGRRVIAQKDVAAQ